MNKDKASKGVQHHSKPMLIDKKCNLLPTNMSTAKTWQEKQASRGVPKKLTYSPSKYSKHVRNAGPKPLCHPPNATEAADRELFEQRILSDMPVVDDGVLHHTICQDSAYSDKIDEQIDLIINKKMKDVKNEMDWCNDVLRQASISNKTVPCDNLLGKRINDSHHLYSIIKDLNWRKSLPQAYAKLLVDKYMHCKAASTAKVENKWPLLHLAEKLKECAPNLSLKELEDLKMESQHRLWEVLCITPTELSTYKSHQGDLQKKDEQDMAVSLEPPVRRSSSDLPNGPISLGSPVQLHQLSTSSDDHRRDNGIRSLSPVVNKQNVQMDSVVAANNGPHLSIQNIAGVAIEPTKPKQVFGSHGYHCHIRDQSEDPIEDLQQDDEFCNKFVAIPSPKAASMLQPTAESINLQMVATDTLEAVLAERISEILKVRQLQQQRQQEEDKTDHEGDNSCKNCQQQQKEKEQVQHEVVSDASSSSIQQSHSSDVDGHQSSISSKLAELSVEQCPKTSTTEASITSVSDHPHVILVDAQTQVSSQSSDSTEITSISASSPPRQFAASLPGPDKTSSPKSASTNADTQTKCSQAIATDLEHCTTKLSLSETSHSASEERTKTILSATIEDCTSSDSDSIGQWQPTGSYSQLFKSGRAYHGWKAVFSDTSLSEGEVRPQQKSKDRLKRSKGCSPGQVDQPHLNSTSLENANSTLSDGQI